uniref:Tyrosine-protein phosphatase domain-containing protein n=1 Tax=Chromera velia CCMP2878 TaxID=1169474 RepID=A0A0G4GT09_9ALVE|eukprot:Cvel_5144.t1-p1 / transcript=Cvel_5144.t1 / gene=Cvel_5144 / organism=Chromera_velia_CCMP2878 / gene_product=hypothetical protein / transcript_product=hypothetical protein / location=Cvel_scaffold235:80516-86300(+) / protein_length=428 / sequence_SO=supercontig / SO=protein_coding / is_pseudo=false
MSDDVPLDAEAGGAANDEEEEEEYVKIKDGLFVGNQICGFAFMMRDYHKITYVVNCADGDVEVLKQDFEDLHILNFKWEDSDDQIILDDQNKNIGEIVKYIRRAEKAGKQAIILSRKGESRSMCVAAAALMKMNNWSLQKALQWMESKQGVKEKMRIRLSLMKQLKAYEQRLFASSSNGSKPTKGWEVAAAVPGGSDAQNSEQVVLGNTFVNQRESGKRSTPAKTGLSRGKRVSWGDGASSEDEPTVCQRKRLEDGSERDCRLRNKRKGAQAGGVLSPSKGILKSRGDSNAACRARLSVLLNFSFLPIESFSIPPSIIPVCACVQKVVTFEGSNASIKKKLRLGHEMKHREEGREALALGGVSTRKNSGRTGGEALELGGMSTRRNSGRTSGEALALKKRKETREARKAGRKVRKEGPKAAMSSSHAR